VGRRPELNSLGLTGPSRRGRLGFLRSWPGCAGSALLFPAIVLPLAHAQQPANADAAASTARVSVHGVVLNSASGEPLARALVRMTGEGSAAMLTDGEGRFELTDVPTGPQQIAIIKPGYLDATAEAAAAARGDAKEFAHTVIVAAEMPDVTFRMEPANAIQGVVQLSTGDSAQGIQVALLRRAVQNGRFVWQTASTVKVNAEGGYRFGGLADGTYAVYSEPAMDHEAADVPSAKNADRAGYPSQFYSDARDLAGAAKMQLQGGEQAEANLFLTLEPFYAVTAMVYPPNDEPVRNPADGNRPSLVDGPGQSLSAIVTDTQGHELAYGSRYDGAAHAITALLPEGSYSLVAMAARRRENEPSPTGAVEFSVAGHSVTNLRIPLANTSRSSVQVNLSRTNSNGQSSNSADSVFLTMTETGGWIGDGVVNAFASGSYPGTLNASAAAPGTYWIMTHLPDQHVCEASLMAGGTNLAREPLTVGVSGSATPIALNLRDDCASLSLSLPGDAGGSGVGEEPFYTVYVVPDFDSTQDVTTQTLRASTGGKTTLQGLTPGNYHVYVFDKPVALAYRERSVLDALPAGQTIELAPGQAASLVLEVPKP
jgi:hypothetical protein